MDATTAQTEEQPGFFPSLSGSLRFLGLGEPPKPRAELPYKDCTNCSACFQDFTFYRHKHQCRACDQAFCDTCCDNFIIWGTNTQTQRTCVKCLHKLSPMDYSKTVDVYDSIGGENTLLLIPSENGTRYNYIYTVEELSKYFRVVTMDIPGLGARSNERPKRGNVLQAIKECIETHCPHKRASLMGLSMGGYLALQFSKEYPDMVDSLIMVGCNVEQYGIQQISHGAVDVVYNVLDKKERSVIMSNLYPTVAKDRMERAYQTTVMNYDHAFECANLMMETDSEFFVHCITAFPKQILFLTGEKDYRGAEVKFVAASNVRLSNAPDKGGKLAIFPNVGHEVLLHQDTFDAIHTEIRNFLSSVYNYKDQTIDLS